MFKKLQKKGFTLVELIVVIAIIGILAAVLIPSITGYINKAKLSNDITDVTNMNKILATTLEVDVENVEYLEAPDIRAIINEKAGGIYDFIPRSSSDGYSYWFDISNKKIVLAKANELGSGLLNNITSLFAADDESGNSIEEFIPGYIYLDKGGTDLATTISLFRTVTSINAFVTNASKYDSENQNNLLNKLKGFNQNQKDNLYAHFNKFHPSKTLYINDFLTFRLGTGPIEKIVFSDGIVSIPTNTAHDISVLPDIVIPYTVKYLEEGAFTSVTSNSRIILLSKTKLGLVGNINEVLSDSLIQTNQHLNSKVKSATNKGLGEHIKVDFVFGDEIEEIDSNSSLKYKPFTFSVNPHVVHPETKEKIYSTSARFDYKENDDGSVYLKVKLFDNDGIIGEKSMTYYSPKDLKMSLDGYTLQFENIVSAFGENADDKLTYYIKIGNSQEVAISAKDISGIRYDYFLGNNQDFARSEIITDEIAYELSLEEFNKLEASEKAQFKFYPYEVDITVGGDVGGESEITYLDGKRIEKYFTKSEKVIGTYFFKDGYLFLTEDQQGFNQNITITEERIQASNPEYDIKNTEIKILEFHIQKNYTISLYKLLSTLFNDNSDSVDISIRAVYGDEEVISKRVTFDNVPKEFIKKSLYDGDDIAGQNLTNFEFEYEIDNSFYIIDDDYDLSKYLKGSYNQDYYENTNDPYAESVYKIKLRTIGKKEDEKIDLVYIIRDLDLTSDSGRYTLEVSTGYHKNEGGEYVKDNPSISLAIDYVPIVLDYTVDRIKGFEFERINNRIIYNGNGATEDNPFVFFKNEEIALVSYTKIIPENGVTTNVTADNLIIDGLNTSQVTDGVQKATITYLHNGVVRYAQTDLHYIVIEKQPVNNVKINGRDYISGQDFLVYSGEKITLNGSVTTIDYILGGNVIQVALNATSLNWDAVENKPYYYSKVDDNTYEKKYRTSAYPVVDFEIWINDEKRDIDLETSQVDYIFEGDDSTGKIVIKYLTKVFYPNPEAPDSYILTTAAEYVATIPYRVVPKRSLENNEVINAVRLNNRTYYQGSIFEFSDGEKIMYGSATYLSYFNAYGTTTTIYNYLLDYTHDGITNRDTPNMVFYISSSYDGEYDKININNYQFKYENGKIKYLKIEATQYNVTHSCIIPITVIDDGADPEATKLIPRMINGILYTGNPIEVKQNSYLGSNYMTQMYYKSRNSTLSYSVLYASNSSMKFSFNQDGPYVSGDEIRFTQPVGTEVTLYVEYVLVYLSLYEIRYTGEIRFKIVDTDTITNNSYINTINGRSVPSTGSFTFYSNETLRVKDYEGDIGYYYYPDYFSLVYRVNASNTTLYEHSNSKEKNRVNFIYELLGNDGNYHQIGPDYQFGKEYESGHRYAQLSGITSGKFRMTYVEPNTENIICSAWVPYVVKDAEIFYINNRNVLSDEVFELYANELDDLDKFSPIFGIYVVNTKKAITYNNENITYYNASIVYLGLNELKNFSDLVEFKVILDEEQNKFILEVKIFGQAPKFIEVPYDFIESEIETIEVNHGENQYKAVLNKTFAYMINNRYHKYLSMFEFEDGERLDFTNTSLRIYFEREPNELGLATFYPRSYTNDAYYSIKLYEDGDLIPVEDYTLVGKDKIDDYVFLKGTSGILIIDVIYNRIYYRTEVEFIVTPDIENAQIHRVNGIYYYDTNATIMIEADSTIIFADSQIRYYYANGYYSPVTLGSGSEFEYYIQPGREGSFIPIEVDTSDSGLKNMEEYFGAPGNKGKLKIDYTLRGIKYTAIFDYEVYETNYNPQVLQINGRSLNGVSQEKPFIFVNGEQLFSKNAAGEYVNNSNSIFIYNDSIGRTIRTNFLVAEDKFDYYLVPSDVDIAKLELGPYRYSEDEDGNLTLIGNETDYLESYRITIDYRFSLDNPIYKRGILRIVHSPSGLSSLTVDIPYEVTEKESELFIRKISILSEDEKYENITYNITEETVIKVLQGQKIKSNTNTQLLFIFAEETEGTYIYANSSAIEFYLVDGNNNETLFELTTNDYTGSMFTGEAGTTGIIRIKYHLYGVTTIVDLQYQIVEI